MNGLELKAIETPPLDDAILQSIVRKIVDAFHLLRIILFGSRARGDHCADSDLDLFVEMESSDAPAERRGKIRRLFRPLPCGLGILGYTPAGVAAGPQTLVSPGPRIEKQ